MTAQQLYEAWKAEEAAAHIEGWDFSHIRGRYREEDDIPWSYDAIVREYRRDEMQLLPGLEKPFPAQTLAIQRAAFEAAGFALLRAEEHFGKIRFYDVGALVWFARVIEWEFAGFSVDRCFDALLRLHRQREQTGVIEGRTHRFLLAAQKRPPAENF